MPWSDFPEAMTDTVTVQPFLSRDGYGAPQYGSPVSYLSRVVYKSVQVRSFDGNVVMARGYFWTTYDAVTDPQDKVTLPDGSAPPLLSFENYKDTVEVGDSHCKAYFG